MHRNLIITLPGWAAVGNSWVMSTLKHRLKKHADILGVSYRDIHNHNVGDFADILLKQLDKNQIHKAYDKIALVGYSMGGLIAALMLSERDFPFVDGFVSIATPFKGTEAAKAISWSVSGKSMMRNSSAVRAIAGVSPVPSLALYAECELWMTNYSGTSFCHEKQVIPNTSHMTIPFVKRTYKEIASWLDYTIFDKDPTEEDKQKYFYSGLSIPSKGLSSSPGELSLFIPS